MGTLVCSPVGATSGHVHSGGMPLNMGDNVEALALTDASFYELSQSLVSPLGYTNPTQGELYQIIPREQLWGDEFSKSQEPPLPFPFNITNEPIELAFRTVGTLHTQDHQTLNPKFYISQGSPPEVTIDNAGYAEHLSFLSVDTRADYYPILSEGQQPNESSTTTTKLLLPRESTTFRCKLCETAFKTKIMLKYVRPLHRLSQEA